MKNKITTAFALISIIVFSAFALADGMPPSKSPLFQSTKSLSATLTANFTDLWAKRNLPPPPGRQSDDTGDAFVTGALVYKDDAGNPSAPLAVQIRVRGHSSKDDCTFPKLRLEFGSTDLSNTIFSKASSVKIATHCSDVEGNSGGYSRLRNQKEPHREAVLYQILDAIGVPSFKARAATITYVDSGANNSITLRDAAFIESPNEFKKRFDVEEIFIQDSAEAQASEAVATAKATKTGKPAVPPVYFTDASSTVDPKADDATDIKAIFAESLLGNVDWDLTIKGQMGWGYPLWNIKAYVRTDGTKFIVPFDFDLARLATNPKTTEMQSNITQYLQRAQAGYADSLYKSTAGYFSDQRKTIETIIDNADFTYPELNADGSPTGKMVDDNDAKSNMKNFLKFFWDSIKN